MKKTIHTAALNLTHLLKCDFIVFDGFVKKKDGIAHMDTEIFCKDWVCSYVFEDVVGDHCPAFGAFEGDLVGSVAAYGGGVLPAVGRVGDNGKVLCYHGDMVAMVKQCPSCRHADDACANDEDAW
ncbi:d-amino acid oxidase [Moniliophthora roreri]|nr:d-amino acid oxidase [Moniliophthora roreri]